MARSKAEHLVWVSVTGVVAIVLLLFLTVAAVTKFGNQADELESVQTRQATDRAAAQHASCLQQNDATIKLREAFAQSVRAVIPADRAEDPRTQAFLDVYLGAVNDNLPRRDCSPAGIVAYFAHPPSEPPCNPDGRGFCKE